MGAIIGLAFRALIGSLAALFGGWKTWIGVGLMSILGIVLYNFITDLVEEILEFVSTQLGGIDAPGGIGDPVGSLTGLAGYIASHLLIPQCIAFICAVVVLKWTLAKIPFIKW